MYSVKKRVAVSPKNDNLSCAVDFNKTNLHDQNLGHSLKIVSRADNFRYCILVGVLVSAVRQIKQTALIHGYRIRDFRCG